VDYETKTGNPEALETGCAILGIYDNKHLTEAGKSLDKAAAGYLAKLAQAGEIRGAIGQTLLLLEVPGVAAERVLLVGLGKDEPLTVSQYQRVLQAGLGRLKESAAKDAIAFLAEVPVRDRDLPWRVRQIVEQAEALRYRFDAFKGKKKDDKAHDKPVDKAPAWKHLAIHCPEPAGPAQGGAGQADAETLARALAVGRATGEGVALCRDLGNTPANVCTPSFLAARAEQLAREHKSVLQVQIFDRPEIERMGMGAFLAVARGSEEPPRFICLEYRGRGAAKDQAPVVLVGKGVTFDSGGISIKPAAAMDEMKYDMSGAASVLGAFKACIALKLPLFVVGLIPATENLPSGTATKPGDIVTTMSGQTVEILNTDAEGRLLLCDALTYAEQHYQPSAVIDIATLTGACVIALGNCASGLLGNNDALIDEVLAAGTSAGDPAWQLPLWEDYQPQLDSNFADMANIGGREGGTITAACFLSRFARKFPWAHLDIAGTAWRTGKQKGSTGRPVPLLVEFLLRRAAAVAAK
jgi:leucyl aminopeptidase